MVIVVALFQSKASKTPHVFSLSVPDPDRHSRPYGSTDLRRCSFKLLDVGARLDGCLYFLYLLWWLWWCSKHLLGHRSYPWISTSLPYLSPSPYLALALTWAEEVCTRGLGTFEYQGGSVQRAQAKAAWDGFFGAPRARALSFRGGGAGILYRSVCARVCVCVCVHPWTKGFLRPLQSGRGRQGAHGSVPGVSQRSSRFRLGYRKRTLFRRTCNPNF